MTDEEWGSLHSYIIPMQKWIANKLNQPLKLSPVNIGMITAWHRRNGILPRGCTDGRNIWIDKLLSYEHGLVVLLHELVHVHQGYKCIKYTNCRELIAYGLGNMWSKENNITPPEIRWRWE